MIDEELAGLLAAGERAVFRGVPGQGIVPLERAELLAGDVGDPARRARAAWLLGVCRTAIGHYGQALAGLTAVAADPAFPAETRSLPASAVAAVHRQLGRTADASSWDELALDTAGDSPEARCDAWLGLASDAVGAGDADRAARCVAEVEQLLADRPLLWRQRIRAEWVRAESGLLVDDPGLARTSAERALDLAEAAGAARHVAKSLLFAGVAATAQNKPAVAIDLLSRAAVLAEGLGARPLIWPSRAMLGALQQASAPQEAEHSLEAARTVVREIAADLPAALAEDWLARGDIRALLS